MKRAVIRRTEMLDARITLGHAVIELSEYATTGLRVVTIGPSGIGKTNTALLVAEQLVAQGWVSVLVDPEGEIESLYGKAVENPDDLRDRLTGRQYPFVVVSAVDADAFIPYGNVILDVADKSRKPIFVALDEGQLFSTSKRRGAGMGRATDLVNQFSERGRKRALDLFLTAHRYTGSLHRSVFSNKNITLVGRQEDPTAWTTLAPQFRSSNIDYSDLAALAPGEFFCTTRCGIEKVRLPMAEALKKVAFKAKKVRPVLPTSFKEWDRAMREIPTERLEELSDDVVGLLGTVAGLTPAQMLAGSRALQDELDSRPVKQIPTRQGRPHGR